MRLMRLMVGCFCLLGLFSCSSTDRAEEQGETDTNDQLVRSFRGTVTGIVPVTQYSGKVAVAGIDPRWVVTIEVSPDENKRGRERKRSYAIHSPTKLFSQPADEVLNKTFDFREYETTGKTGRVLSRRLEVVLPEKPARLSTIISPCTPL